MRKKINYNDVLFLIQAAEDLPSVYSCLKKRNYVLLSYKKNTPQSHIYLPNSTWTEGRNKLHHYALNFERKYVYYVFLDEDILFPVGNKKGFDLLLQSLSIGYPIITPRLGYYNTPKNNTPEKQKLLHQPENVRLKEVWRKGVENGDFIFQSVDWFDAACNAFSYEAFTSNKVLPYDESFDKNSWWISQFILILRANHFYHNQAIQINRLTYKNLQHSVYQSGDVSFNKAYDYLLKQLNLKTIKTSDGIEIIPQHKIIFPKFFFLKLNISVKNKLKTLLKKFRKRGAS